MSVSWFYVAISVLLNVLSALMYGARNRQLLYLHCHTLVCNSSSPPHCRLYCETSRRRVPVFQLVVGEAPSAWPMASGRE